MYRFMQESTIDTTKDVLIAYVSVLKHYFFLKVLAYVLPFTTFQTDHAQ